MSKTGTKTPLRILVLPPVTRWKDELEALRERGHEIVFSDGPLCLQGNVDLIIGEAAWHMTKAHKGYLVKAVEAAQKRVKAAKKGDE